MTGLADPVYVEAFLQARYIGQCGPEWSGGNLRQNAVNGYGMAVSRAIVVQQVFFFLSLFFFFFFFFFLLLLLLLLVEDTKAKPPCKQPGRALKTR